jgi:hypothetical protein
MSSALRQDVHVPNESDGFVFTSRAMRGRGLMPGESAWNQAVAACELLPLVVESEDPANVRVVVGGALTADEQAGWVGRVTGGLRVRDGQLAICGGAAYVIDKDDWVDGYARVVTIPAGDYVATLYCYASAPNGRLCLDQTGDEALGQWFRRTRPGQPMPVWLHNLCVHDPEVDPGHQKEWARAEQKPGAPVVDFLLHLEPASEPLAPAAVQDHGFAEAADCRRPEPMPLGLAADVERGGDD